MVMVMIWCEAEGSVHVWDLSPTGADDHWLRHPQYRAEEEETPQPTKPTPVPKNRHGRRPHPPHTIPKIAFWNRRCCRDFSLSSYPGTEGTNTQTRCPVSQ